MWLSVACFWCQSFGDVSPCVCSLYFCSVWVAEWQSFGKQLPTRLAICFRSILSVCDFGYFPFWFWGWDLPSDCSNSCSLLSHYFWQYENQSFYRFRSCKSTFNLIDNDIPKFVWFAISRIIGGVSTNVIASFCHVLQDLIRAADSCWCDLRLRLSFRYS